ncbi:molybdopterin molybdotransferase MoeA [Limibacillus halophilus]|uniref:Molybdopterin molybdenumtransferase n=1 Tax=Limibacillus halophilus TaxID=1579333 RepID=A0A839SXZ6_9PROT|nr:gephyrin-like molybdotransferase Glp [Limibacillus halophilus]MBB3065895.1 molybdopterin molybdotransferase [Limibacillus halophilus]
MISVEEAQARILKEFATTPAEIVTLSDSLGRVLADDLESRRTQPPMDVSAMDGYAVRASDVLHVPTTLKVTMEIPAGSLPPQALAAGEAARIFTGAPVPPGADSVVIQEDTEAAEDEVTILETAKRGAYVRRAGLDFREGEVKLRAGTRLGAREIGLAAAMNRPWLPLRRRPRIALLATGDEVVMPGDPIRENQIVSSNVLALAALIEQAGGVAVNLGIAADREDALDNLRDRARGCDLLITTGGASVGKHDLVQSALQRSDLSLDFWKIAMRPGKPLMFGRWPELPVLGLPGNPVSSLVCGYLFLLPIMAKLLGAPDIALSEETGLLEHDLKENDRRQDYLRALFVEPDGNGPKLKVFERQDSSMLATLQHADALIIRRPQARAAKAGETCSFLRLPRP